MTSGELSRVRQTGCWAPRCRGVCFWAPGLHTGYVGFAVESHPGPPAVGDEWEDVVEACFHPVGPDARLVQWGGQAPSA